MIYISSWVRFALFWTVRGIVQSNMTIKGYAIDFEVAAQGVMNPEA